MKKYAKLFLSLILCLSLTVGLSACGGSSGGSTAEGDDSTLIIALFLGSCLLCMTSAMIGEGGSMKTVFLVMGLVGYAVSIFFAYRVYRNMKKGK